MTGWVPSLSCRCPTSSAPPTPPPHMLDLAVGKTKTDVVFCVDTAGSGAGVYGGGQPAILCFVWHGPAEVADI